MNDSTGRRVEEAVRSLLVEMGEDPAREGLVQTPERVRRMYAELTDGYRTDPESLLNGASFDVAYDEMVVVRDIEMYSLCEHHLLPFHGRAHVGYLPRGRVIGLSKIPRIVDMYAHRLQVQERLTTEIAAQKQEIVKLKKEVEICQQDRHAQSLCLKNRRRRTAFAYAVVIDNAGMKEKIATLHLPQIVSVIEEPEQSDAALELMIANVGVDAVDEGRHDAARLRVIARQLGLVYGAAVGE